MIPEPDTIKDLWSRQATRNPNTNEPVVIVCPRGDEEIISASFPTADQIDDAAFALWAEHECQAPEWIGVGIPSYLDTESHEVDPEAVQRRYIDGDESVIDVLTVHVVALDHTETCFYTQPLLEPLSETHRDAQSDLLDHIGGVLTKMHRDRPT